MKDNSKKIHLIEKKLESSSNDLFKSIACDLLKLFDKEINKCEMGVSNYSIWIDSLRKNYQKELHELQKEQKNKSKQLEITDEQTK